MHSVSHFCAALALIVSLSGCSGGNGSAAIDRQDASIADAALTAGNPEVALRLADETLVRNPDDAGALVQRGMALTVLGRLDEARGNLLRAVAIQPRNPKALLALGRVQLPVDPAAAETSFLAVISQNNQNAAALNDLGIARDLLGRYAQAEAAFRAAVAASPEMTAAQVNLALCLAIRGEGNEAVKLLRPLADGPGATRKMKEDYAAVLAMAGDKEEAKQILSANLGEGEVAPALDILASLRTPGDSVTR